MKGLISALRTLTITPVPGCHEDDFASSLPWFPVVGLSMGLLIWATAWVLMHVMGASWTVGIAWILVLLNSVLTRGLHLDGLADWADAMGGQPTPASRLAILKDSRLGTFGAVGLMVVLSAKWLALDRMITNGSLVGVPLTLIISRGMMVELITRLPNARPEEGMATPFVRGATTRARVMSHIVVFVLCLGGGAGGVVLYALGWVLTFFFTMHCRRSFGGVTGDLIGALNEILETVLLFVCALQGGYFF